MEYNELEICRRYKNLKFEENLCLIAKVCLKNNCQHSAEMEDSTVMQEY